MSVKLINLLIEIGTPFLAALAGGGVTLIGVFIAHKHDLKLAENARQQKVRSLLQAIHDELQVIWSRYSTTGGKHLETAKEGEPFHSTWFASHDYFSVYHGNTHLIGEIENDELRRIIIRTYTQAKGLLDTFSSQREATWELWRELGKDRHNEGRIERLNNSLTEAVPLLKEEHEKLENLYECATAELRREIARLRTT